MREPLAFFFLFLSTIGCTYFAKYKVINFLFDDEMSDTPPPGKTLCSNLYVSSGGGVIWK